MFNDQQVNASIMMIVALYETGVGTMVDTLHDGRIYTFHAAQLDVMTKHGLQRLGR